MRALKPREKRTVRWAVIAVAAYLLLFYGVKGIHFLEGKRTVYEEKRQLALQLDTEILLEQKKQRALERLKESWRIDAGNVHPERAIGAAREAIVKSAQICGVGLGPSRESPGRSASREVAMIQLEGTGPTPAVVLFLHNLKRLGFPLIIDRLQIQTVPKKPGHVSLGLNVALLNFTAWRQSKEPGDP